MGTVGPDAPLVSCESLMGTSAGWTTGPSPVRSPARARVVPGPLVDSPCREADDRGPIRRWSMLHTASRRRRRLLVLAVVLAGAAPGTAASAVAAPPPNDNISALLAPTYDINVAPTGDVTVD